MAMTALVGEGLDQVDLPGVERSWGRARQHHDALDFAVSQQRHGQNRPNTRERGRWHIDFRVGEHIGYADGLPA